MSDFDTWTVPTARILPSRHIRPGDVVAVRSAMPPRSFSGLRGQVVRELVASCGSAGALGATTTSSGPA
jgi:hypothetical protein